MKVSEWKEMLSKLKDDDELCIAKPSQDYCVVRINYNEPQLLKKEEIDESWRIDEINKFPNDNVDYVIY